MEQIVSFDAYKNMFDQYANHYDRSDGRVELKIVHTNAVVAIMKKLCEMRGLSGHMTGLALICAQFHDIGRFEQLKKYDTFLDHLSVNHAVLSCQILREQGMLDGLSAADREKVLTAIENHNKLEIDPEIVSAAGSLPDAQECLELCKLIRDADKCDIFRVFATDNMVDVIGVSDEEVTRETVSPSVLQAIREHRCIDKQIRKTYLDFWISFLGYFFDLNYKESMAIAREQGYYRVPFDRVTFQNPQAREQVQEALTIVEDYIRDFSSDKPAPILVPNLLKEFFAAHPLVALAFSGGCDSSYLLYAAKSCGCKVRAYYVSTPFQPQFELEDARRLAAELHADMTVLPFDVLSVDAVRKNPADRCYYCKNAIFNGILKAAAGDGYEEILDGTNASDDAGDRPGMRALQELKILSPLRLCHITKKQVREYSRSAGLFTWDKPAYACLATRIPSGVAIDGEILEKVEWAENELFKLGFTDFRVRVLPEPWLSEGAYAARLQVTEKDLPLLMEKREIVGDLLKTKFADVFLDMNARAASN